MLAAADFESFEVRPSRIVFEAAVAASALVSRSGVPDWDRALAAESLDDSLVLLLRSVVEALDDAFFPVVFSFLAIVGIS